MGNISKYENVTMVSAMIKHLKNVDRHVSDHLILHLGIDELHHDPMLN